MTLHRIGFLLAASLYVLAPSNAYAQQGPRDPAANSLVRQAMQDYQDLEIDRALERLNTALRACGTSGCSNSVLARVHMSIGIVRVGGQQNQSEGVSAMVQALRIDSHAEPDTLLATPEITQAFEEARRQGGGSTTSGRTPPSSGVTPPPTRPPPSGGGDLLHTPAVEQLENTALPVYVEPATQLVAAHVYVHYKGNGMRVFQRVEMQRVGQGWGVEIPCGQIIQGPMSYYITAVDDGGGTIASTGSDSTPVEVSILPASARRTVPAPNLPGRPAPEACSSAEECPPGMSGPQCRSGGGGGGGARGNGGLGDPCARTSECGEGMICDGGSCIIGEENTDRGNETPGGPTAPRGAFSRLSIDIGGGLGLAFLSGTHSYAEQFVNQATRQPECGSYTCYRNIEPGFAPTYFLATNIRYNVTQRIGVSIGARFQFDTAGWTVDPPRGSGAAKENPFANLLLYGRVYYAFTPNGFAPTGIVGSAFAGGGVGQIEPKPGVPASARFPSAHVVSGYGNVQVGGRVEYGLRNGFHVAGELTLHFMVPTFLFNADFAAFVGFHF